jgi:hypothetical protein
MGNSGRFLMPERIYGPDLESGIRHFHAHLNPLPEFPALTHVHEAHCSAGHWLPQHIHETFEIVYVASGSGQWNFEQQEHALRPGDLYLIQPGELHGGRADPQDPYTTFIAGFDPAALPLSGTLQSSLGALEAPQPKAHITRSNKGVLVMNTPMRDLSQAAEQVRVLDAALGAKPQRVMHGAPRCAGDFPSLVGELDGATRRPPRAL